MSAKRIGGIVVILVGVWCIAVWTDRMFFQPSGADKSYMNRIADFGGNSATQGKHPAAIFLMVGVGALICGQGLVKK